VPTDIADVEDRVYGADRGDFVNERAAAAMEPRADGRRTERS
jgi:hypothetical protein